MTGPPQGDAALGALILLVLVVLSISMGMWPLAIVCVVILAAVILGSF